MGARGRGTSLGSEGRIREDGRPRVAPVYARSLARLERDEPAYAIYHGRLDSAALEPEDRFLMGLTRARMGKLDTAVESGKTPGRKAAIIPRCSITSPASRSDRSGWTRRSRWPGGSRKNRAGRPEATSCSADIQEFLDNPTGSRRRVSLGVRARARRQGRPVRCRPLSQAPGQEPASDSAAQPRPTSRSGPAGRSAEPETRKRSAEEAYWLLSRGVLAGRQDDRSRRCPLAFGLLSAPTTAICPSPALFWARPHARMPPPRGSQVPGDAHIRSFHHGAGLLNLPLPDRPLADPDDPKVTHTIAQEGSEDRGRDAASATASTRWSSTTPSARPSGT